MPASGQNFNQSIFVNEDRDSVSQKLISGASGISEYTITTAGVGSLVLSRKYRPTWAIVVSVLGLLFFLIGVLGLLYTVTEILTITLATERGGTRIVVSGVGSQEMLERITGILGSFPVLPITSGRKIDQEIVNVESKTCPSCAELVKVAANICRFCGHQFTKKRVE
jgi:Uncharacterised protein family UPF0547